MEEFDNIFNDIIESANESSIDENDDITFNITATMKTRWIPHFMTMLQYMEDCGKSGCSREVGLYADGDGDFRPIFKADIDYVIVKPVKDHDGNKLYDAG